jgi:ribosomal protein S18 acetylase RimI-like enzyme
MATMPAGEVAALYRAARSAGIRLWIDGGWCVDALVGHQTRAHDDLDVAVDRDDVDALTAVWAGAGYRAVPESSSTPWNFVMVDGLGRRIDIHVFHVDVTGRHDYGVAYPARSLRGTGVIDGETVECVAVESIYQFKTAYQPAAKDEADIRRLRALRTDSYTVRPLAPGDADEVAAVHVAIWKATYPGMVNQAKLDALTPADRIDRWRRTITDIDRQEQLGVRTRCSVHEPSGDIIGFATAGPPREEHPPAPTALWSLNVLPRHHGSGIGARLMSAVIGDRTGPAYLWVATGNARAIAFYRKRGFELDGVTHFDPEWDCQESRMVTP